MDRLLINTETKKSPIVVIDVLLLLPCDEHKFAQALSQTHYACTEPVGE